MGFCKGPQRLPLRKKGILDGSIQEQTFALEGIEATDYETVTGKGRKGKKIRLYEQNSMHFFLLFSAADGLTSWCLSLEMGQAELSGRAAATVLLGCWQGSSPAHRPLSSSLEGVWSGCKWSLVSRSPSPSYHRKGSAQRSVSHAWAGLSEDSTKRKNPSLLAPPFNSCGVRQLGNASPDPKARGWLSRGGNLGRNLDLMARVICFFATIVSRIIKVVAVKLLRPYCIFGRERG